MDIKEMLGRLVSVGASDVFAVAGLPLSYKTGKQERITEGEPLMPRDTEDVAKQVYALANRSFERFENNYNHDEDFSFSIAGMGRFRANAFRQRGSIAMVIRIIPFGLPDPKECHIPEEVLSVTRYPRGLVLVTGSAGSGKTTTLACMVDRLNHERTGHIVTMEDPIEYVHHHNSCIVTQREIPTDVATYEEALRSALREAPDVLLLGEMRDRETMAASVTAAEMSQLVLSTMHTVGAATTVDRIVDSFPASQQRQIRMQLSMVLRAVISEQLVPTIDGGVIPAFEVMICNTAIRNLIREEKAYQIDSVVSASAAQGMRTMDQSLYTLVRDGIVDRNVALQHATHQAALKNRLEATGL